MSHAKHDPRAYERSQQSDEDAYQRHLEVDGRLLCGTPEEGAFVVEQRDSVTCGLCIAIMCGGFVS